MSVYDNSQLQAYKTCPESYRLRYVENLNKRVTGEESHDRYFGKAIHSSLERYYKARQANKPLLTANYHAPFQADYPVALSEEDMAKTPEGGILLLDAYLKHYAQEDNEMEILAVEVKDEFPIGKTSEGKDILFTVKIDLIIKKQGCVYFLDHKTTGKALTYSYWSQFDPNSQITAYTAYCLWKYGECSGGIINALRFGHRQRAYKGEPAGFYQEFQRSIINRNRAQVEAWKQDQVEWIEKLERERSLVMPSMSWNKNENACVYCQYKEICISVNDDQIIEQLYEKEDAQAYLSEEKPQGEMSV